MTERRPLVEGLKPTPVNPQLERDFVYQNREVAKQPTVAPPTVAPQHVARVPVSTRLRADFATALKRASLERQLNAVEPSTLQDILEQAIEPWLRSNGYIP